MILRNAVCLDYCHFLMNNKVKGALFKSPTLSHIITASSRTLIINSLTVLSYTSYLVYITHTHIHSRVHTHSVYTHTPTHACRVPFAVRASVRTSMMFLQYPVHV